MKPPTWLRHFRILVLVPLVIIGFYGFHDVHKDQQKIQLRNVQLQDTDLQLKTIQLRYDAAIKELDKTKGSDAQAQKALQDATQQLQQLQQQKRDLESQLEAKRNTAKVYAASVPVAPLTYGAPVASGSCGDNSYANYIYMHESGCNPSSVNSIGCRGIGQACPGSKLPCGADYACQNAFFTSYALSVYGSWAQAYNFWVANHWW